MAATRSGSSSGDDGLMRVWNVVPAVAVSLGRFLASGRKNNSVVEGLEMTPNKPLTKVQAL